MFPYVGAPRDVKIILGAFSVEEWLGNTALRDHNFAGGSEENQDHRR
jgi:hypothetical protein